MSKARDKMRSDYMAREFAAIEAEADAKTQAYMRRAVAELQKVHGMSERDAASIMLTITSVVGLGPK